MQIYDTVIVGAGPAGGQCARELALAGFKVLLIDKAKSFSENNYSSGGAPLDILSDFSLPSSVVGVYWNTLRVLSTHSETSWTTDALFGPILNFDQLRTFLVDQTVQAGGLFQLGCQYQNHQIYSQWIEVYLKHLDSGTIFPIKTTVLVDATGSERKVLVKSYNKHQAIAATGIEYHIKVDPSIYQKYAQSLNFFLGHHWMPQGYAWIFPMNDEKLKVGVIRYFQNKNHLSYEPSYQFYLQRLLKECGSYQIQDKHGKTIYYTLRQKDLRFNGPILAIGDAVSSINPLGWEGIRHAMVSGRLAAQTVQRYLKKDIRELSSYSKNLNRYFGLKWICTEKMANYLFTNKHDAWIDKIVHFFSLMNNEEIMNVIFHYQFRHTIKSFLYYFFSRFKDRCAIKRAHE
jgi:digeranylgeranylglycerophospholipid reductase